MPSGTFLTGEKSVPNFKGLKDRLAFLSMANMANMVGDFKMTSKLIQKILGLCTLLQIYSAYTVSKTTKLGW